MAREKSDIVFQNVTVRIPKELYAAYKDTLKKEGKIPTYDIRNHMFSVVEKYNKNMKGEE